MKRVRRRYRVVVLAAIVAALVVPVGFALSLSSGHSPVTAAAVRPAVPAESLAASSPVLIATDREAAPFFEDVPEAAKLFLVGTMLFGIAIAVRKAA